MRTSEVIAAVSVDGGIGQHFGYPSAIALSGHQAMPSHSQTGVSFQHLVMQWRPGALCTVGSSHGTRGAGQGSAHRILPQSM